MDNEQITALSREWAENTIGSESASPMYFGIERCDMETHLRWLSKRFCLVEKSAIAAMWEDITNVYLAHRHITYDGARYIFEQFFGKNFTETIKE